MVDGGNMVDLENLNYDDIDGVSKLQKNLRYIDTVLKVEDALEKGFDMPKNGAVLENDPEYRLKFPELESLVHHPIDYARVVKRIGNQMDLTVVDLEGLVLSAIIMVVSIAASTTSGKPLPEEVLRKTIEACDRALALDSSKKKVLDCVESRMGYIAPNLSAIVGSAVAAKLMGTAGGLSALAKMPGCNVQCLGAKNKKLAVSAKSTLAARFDSNKLDPTGKTGRAFRDEIHRKIEKWQEPPPAKQPQLLPVPDSKPKIKGLRWRSKNPQLSYLMEVKLWNDNCEREMYENFAEFFAIIKAIEKLEKAYVRDINIGKTKMEEGILMLSKMGAADGQVD
ncbi:hypothetical protein RHSIM_Rhsim02G0120300 [Rhododendron simsii]|uniref:Nop domain-containing protein n=1 Tax=Rhododendron simsii TaxID=118357 RepID=A0A834HAL1_RHOSS|nr:hypothetical protein RHSIM_Rhsim02G0120300 [Rhododendron simsii]